jgi:hypothetical protein
MATRVITNPDGSVGLEEYTVQETKLETYTRKNGSKGQRTVMTTGSGFGAIYESGVLTETHTIYVKAFDKAGNEAESEKVRFLVMHKPKEDKKKTGMLWPTAPVATDPDRWREIRLAVGSTGAEVQRCRGAGTSGGPGTQSPPQCGVQAVLLNYRSRASLGALSAT